jgi:hypothetical protein
MVSDDIIAARDRYMALMLEHGAMRPEAIADGLAETQAELLGIFRSITGTKAHASPGEGEWCMHELAQHAAFTERLIVKLVHHLSRGGTPTADDFKGAGIGMMPEADVRSYAEVLDELESRNAEILEAVRSLPEAPNTEMKLPHPFFGPLNCLEWAGFQRVHDLDHIQHARKIVAAVSG